MATSGSKPSATLNKAAERALSRRALLRTLPLATASTIPALAATASLAAPAEPSADLVRLIAAHRQSSAAFSAIYDLADERHPDYDPSFTGWDSFNAAEEAAREAVLAAPCHSLADVRAKAAHLLQRIETGHEDLVGLWEIEALLRSI